MVIFHPIIVHDAKETILKLGLRLHLPATSQRKEEIGLFLTNNSIQYVVGEVPKTSKKNLAIRGTLAQRINNILKKYGTHKSRYSLPSGSLNCHGTALYVTGLQDNMRGVRAAGIKGFYFGNPQKSVTLSLEEPIEYDPGTVIAHAFRREVQTVDLKNFEFRSDNCVHSVVLIGKIGDTTIVFEKDGPFHARFSTLCAVLENYAPIRSVLYVEITNNFL